MANNTPLRQTCNSIRKHSYKDIRITAHAKQRAYERLNLNKDSEIQKLAIAARYKGIKVRCLNETNYSTWGLTYNMFRYLKNHYAHHYANDRIYYYKDFCWIFMGNNSLTLKSIVPCNTADMKVAISKIDRCPVEEVED